jgi:hypothetical protein
MPISMRRFYSIEKKKIQAYKVLGFFYAVVRAGRMHDELDAGAGKLQSIIDHTPWCLLRKTNKSIMFFFRTGKSLPFSRQAIVKKCIFNNTLIFIPFYCTKSHLQLKKLQAFLEFFVYTIDPGQKPEHRYYQTSPVNQPDH